MKAAVLLLALLAGRPFDLAPAFAKATAGEQAKAFDSPAPGGLAPLDFARDNQAKPGKPRGAPTDFNATLQHALGRPMVGDWQPYVLDLQNQMSRDVDARIRVEDDATRTAVARRETIGAGGRKRLFFYLPVGFRGLYGGFPQPKFHVTDAGGRRLSSGVSLQSWSGLEANAFQVGLLSSDKSPSLNVFGFPTAIGQTPVVLARLSPEIFPDRWIGLAPLDALILHDSPLSELTPDQARALADYVRQGGTVILSPGLTRGWLRHDVIRGFVDILAGEPEERTELPRLNAAFGPFDHKETFLFHRLQNGTDDPQFADSPHREVVTFAAGFGHVTVLPFDVRRGPLVRWQGLESLWQVLIGRVPRRFQSVSSSLVPASTADARLNLFQAISSLVNPYPSFLLLVFLAVSYLLTVGPANYLVLRRLGMSLLIVVTVPAISAAFLALTFGIGYVLKGTSTVVYTARFLWTRPGLDCARETQLFSVFSPATRAYDIALGPGGYGLPLERLGRGEDERYVLRGNRETLDRLECEDAGSITLKEVGVGQWQSWNMEVRAVRDLGRGIRFETSGDTLRVSNLSAKTIARGTYIEAGHGALACPFGEVPAGRTVEVPLDRNRYEPMEDLGLAGDPFAAKILANYFQGLKFMSRSGPARQRQERLLFCVLPEDGAAAKVNARTSGSSRAVTLLQVVEEKP